MLILKRFFALISILLFISISYLLIVAERGSTNLESAPIQQPSRDIDKFVNKLFPNQEKSDLHISSIKFPLENNQSKNVLEIDEVNLHQVSLIFKENGNLKALNWFKCKPNGQVFLSTNPFFILDQKALEKDITVVYSGSSLSVVPFKLYGYNDFFIRKANHETAKTITILLLLSILIVSLFIYFTLNSFYSLIFSVYISFCLLSNLVYNGFANNFWPFNIPYLSDHFLGFALSIHMLLISYFMVYLIDRYHKKIKYHYISYLPLIISISFLFLSTVFESFILLKYLLLFALILCLSFAIYYPKIFSDYKKKDAYWLNYLGIFCFTLLFFLSAAKYFNLFKASTFFDISNKILFVGHIVSLYFAFLLIIKSRLVQKFTNANLFDQESEIGEGRNNESLSVVLASLSEREYIVLELISMGLKDQDIADRLIVSITTIKTHKQRVYKKLNINSRSQATQIFLKFTSKTLNLINN